LAKVDKRSDPDENIHDLFRDWLRGDDSGRWLIVIDNADEIDFLVERSNGETSMFKRLPVCDHGTILITSRSKISASKLVQFKEMIEIPPMREQQAITLIEKRLGRNEYSAKLAAAVDYMPLAITQAAAYIEQRGERTSVQRYIDKLQKGDPWRKSVLDENVKDLRRDEDARNAITLTWQISFEHIRRLRRSAADLLSLMSFCDRQAIPEMLLRVKRPSLQDGEIPNDDDKSADCSGADDSEPSSDDESVMSADDSFERDIAMLKGFAFISNTTAEDSTFEMHRLVQRATQRWLQSQKQFAHWRAEFLYNLADVHPDGQFENWKVCQKLYPHVRVAVDMKTAHDAEELDQAVICQCAGWYACCMHRFGEAEELLMKAYGIFGRIRGEENEWTLEAVNCLALVYGRVGRSTEAEKLQTKILETTTRLLGADHPDTLAHMHNLALTYIAQGRLDDAEKLYVKVIEAGRGALGSEHADTLISMHGLAHVYQEQKRWIEAEELFDKVVEARTRVLGPEHADTLISMHGLAHVYQDRKQWREAEELYDRVVEARSRVLGSEHADTLYSMHELARVYLEQKRWIEAEELYDRVVEARSRVLGSEHADTLSSLHQLALVYQRQERLLEAEELFDKVVEAETRVLGPRHASTLLSMACLSDVYRRTKQWNKAEDLMVRVVQGHEEVLGVQDPKTLYEVAFLAKVYHESGQYDKAEELRLRTIHGYEQIYGAQDLKTLRERGRLADVYFDSRQYAKAEDVMVQVVQGYEEVYGAQDEGTLSEVDFLAKVRRAREEAESDGAAGQDRPSDFGGRSGQPSIKSSRSESSDEQDAGGDEAIDAPGAG
jgi:tetratricopeptide (TPR) repeat protein